MAWVGGVTITGPGAPPWHSDWPFQPNKPALLGVPWLLASLFRGHCRDDLTGLVLTFQNDSCHLQGYNVNAVTIDHVTPLHEACLGDHVACARTLLEAGANVSPCSMFASTKRAQIERSSHPASLSFLVVLRDSGIKTKLSNCPAFSHSHSKKEPQSLQKWGSPLHPMEYSVGCALLSWFSIGIDELVCAYNVCPSFG